MFTKKNLSGERLSPAMHVLVLHLRRALIFFINIYLIIFLTSFSSFIKNIKYTLDFRIDGTPNY